MFVIFLMLAGTGWADMALGSPATGRDGGRAQDTEPNDVYTSASPIANDGTVEGSLGTTSSSDNIDVYSIEGGVSPLKVVTITLYLVDYDESNHSSINFNIALSYLYYDYYMWAVSSTSGTNRTETATYFQTLNFAEPEQMWICVTMACGSLGGRYQLTVRLSDPTELSVGQTTGYLNDEIGPQGAYYKVKKLPDNVGTRLSLQCPATGLFYLMAYNIWPPGNEWWTQNASLTNNMGCLQQICLVGMGGTYYVVVTIPTYYYPGGNGTYQLYMEWYGNPQDANNFPATADIVNSNSPYHGHVASGVDTADWYRVDVRANRTVEKASMTIPTPSTYVSFNFSAFDKDLNCLAEGQATIGTTTVDLGSFTANYTGPIYFAVRAVPYIFYYLYNDASSTYTLQFLLPNDPPQLNDTLPAVVMDEDATDSSLVLSDHIWDPDDHHVNYTLVGSKYNSSPVVDRETGRVTFRPLKNWWGSETVKFLARDNGPDQKFIFVNTTVTVNAVNDFPAVAALAKDGSIKEEEVWQTADLTTMFSDVDDVPANLSFGCRVVYSDTHPPGGLLPIKYNAKTRSFILGPAHLFWGAYELELSCSDNKPDAVPATTRLNLTIGHIDHEPLLKENITDPYPVSVQERGTSSELLLDELFTDPDLPKEYAGDLLTYSVSGMNRLSAAINTARRLVISAGTEQYTPGFPGMETLTVVASDKAGRTATLHILVTVEPVNDPPVLISSQPAGGTVSIKELEKKGFSLVVNDLDTDASDLTYCWYVDGAKDAYAKGSTFTFEPDYKMGGAAHIIQVEVSDGNATISGEWSVTVKDVNRLPEGSITSPVNSTRYVKGTVISFSASATDLDDEAVTFIWRDRTGAEIGRGPMFTYSKLQKGIQTIRLEITDGKGSIYREVTIEVTSPPAPQAQTPGFGAALLCAVVALTLLLAVQRRTR